MGETTGRYVKGDQQHMIGLSPSLANWNLARSAGSQVLTMALRIAEYCLFLSSGGIPLGEAIDSKSAFSSGVRIFTRAFFAGRMGLEGWSEMSCVQQCWLLSGIDREEGYKPIY